MAVYEQGNGFLPDTIVIHKPTSLYGLYHQVECLHVSVKLSNRGNLIGPAPHYAFHSHFPHIQSKWSLQASFYQLWFMKLGLFQACKCLTLGIGNCHKKYFQHYVINIHKSDLLYVEEGFTEEVIYELGFKTHVVGLPWQVRWCRICLQCRRLEFDPWVRQIPWRRGWQPAPVLFWRIPWTVEPDGLQSMGWQSQTQVSN